MSPKKGQPADEVTKAILDAGRSKGHAKRRAAAAARKGADMSGGAPPATAPVDGEDPTAPKVLDSSYAPVPPPPGPPTRRTTELPTPAPTPPSDPGVHEPPADRDERPASSNPLEGVIDWVLRGVGAR